MVPMGAQWGIGKGGHASRWLGSRREEEKQETKGEPFTFGIPCPSNIFVICFFVCECVSSIQWDILINKKMC